MSLKKVGIITLNSYFNYGNRLQNYAAQEVLKSLGLSVETIKVKNVVPVFPKEKFNPTEKFKRLIKMSMRTFKNKMWHKLNQAKIIEAEKDRTKKMIDFSKKYIIETDYTIEENNIPSHLNQSYDYFVTGSDQVWNPNFLVVSSIHFLQFADKNKRIAFSPSFGVSEIPKEKTEQFSKWLSEMHSLSVREDTGANIIKELTGREALVLADPTLLLTKEKWLEIAKASTNRPNEKYILTYFLGEISIDYQNQIKKIAKDNKMKIVNLAKVEEIKVYQTDPSEFIDFIAHASLICTDSFHGSVFSILMQRPFIVYDRISPGLSMYDRINTLLSKFNLENRKSSDLDIHKNIFNIDYTNTQLILDKERNRTINYLKEALNIV
jgi:hypothetical protein